MLLSRVLDTKIVSIQRQGRIGPYVPCIGEEGAVVPSAFSLEKNDWLFTSYRELGAHLARGMSVDLILAQLFGNSNDLLKGRQMSNSWGSKVLNDVPTAAPIGAYLPVAVGVAIAAKLKKQKAAVLAFLGDGGTSSSDFHVALNFAGVNKAPIVFICRNNGWAISLPVAKQTASESIAIKAKAYGFEGKKVDGSDSLAVYAASKSALEKARLGGGPTLIEVLTYRAGPHSTADDPKRYRKDEPSWENKDPVRLLKEWLVSKRLWNDEDDTLLIKEYEAMIAKSITKQESIKPLPVKELIFEDVYSEIPWNLNEQAHEISEE
jgi:pyruvate dehydrogenase E1 component alpha subunit